MASILYPDRKKASNKNFLKNHVNDIRVTQKENKQRQIEEQQRHIDADRLRNSLLKNTMSRYNNLRSSSRAPSIAENAKANKPSNLHNDFGRVPEYIKRFEADKVAEEKRLLEIAEASKVPKGCRYMSDEERLSSLEDVKKSRSILLEELKSMPLNLITLKQRRRKIEIDLKICELDKLASLMVDDITSIYDLVSNDKWLTQDYLSSKLVVSQDTTQNIPAIPQWDGSITYDVCIFHAPCNDGSAAAYGISLKFPKCEFLGVNRGSGVNDTFLSSEILESKISGKNIVLVDFVFPKYSMMDLLDCAKHVLVIDHHVSEYEILKHEIGLPESCLIYSPSTSACILTWKYFHTTVPIPALIHYINDSDTAEYALENTSAVISGLAVCSPIVGPGLWTVLDDPFREFHRAIERGDDFIRSMIIVGMISREIEWRDVYTDAQRCIERRLGVFPQTLCRVLNVSPGSRMGALANALLSGSFSDPPRPPCDVAILYYKIDVNGSFKISFRSNEGVNVGEIARLLGGGGHGQAASVTLYSSSIDDLFLCDTDDYCPDEVVIDGILEKLKREDENWSSSRIDFINGLRNGWKMSPSEEDISILRQGLSLGIRVAEIEGFLLTRGIAEIENGTPWCGIGLLSSGRIVYYKIDGDKTVVFESRLGSWEEEIDDPNNVWPLYESGYKEYYFWDTWGKSFVDAESLEKADSEGPKKLVRLANIS